MNTNKIKKKAAEVTKEFVILNIGIVLLGIFLVIFPKLSASIICYIIGVILSIWGLFKVIEYFRIKNEFFGSFSLVQGCALLGFGIYILVSPGFLSAIIAIVLNMILFIGAIMKLQYTFEFARLKSKGWAIQAVGAVLVIAACIIAFLNPFGAADFLMIFIGISLIFDGVWDLITMIYVSKFVKNIEKAVKSTLKDEEMVDAEYTDEDND